MRHERGSRIDDTSVKSPPDQLLNQCKSYSRFHMTTGALRIVAPILVTTTCEIGTEQRAVITYVAVMRHLP
jgi:hypothetical protein